MNNTPDTFTSAAEQDMSETRQAFLTGERAEFFAHDRRYVDTIFDDGESPLKHAHDIELRSSSFKWKYPLWYCSDIDAKDCTWFEMARAGVWYTDHITVEDSTIEAPKNFRRCHDVTLRNVDFVNAEETLLKKLWKNITTAVHHSLLLRLPRRRKIRWMRLSVMLPNRHSISLIN